MSRYHRVPFLRAQLPNRDPPDLARLRTLVPVEHLHDLHIRLTLVGRQGCALVSGHLSDRLRKCSLGHGKLGVVVHVPRLTQRSAVMAQQRPSARSFVHARSGQDVDAQDGPSLKEVDSANWSGPCPPGDPPTDRDDVPSQSRGPFGYRNGAFGRVTSLRVVAGPTLSS